MKTLYLVNNCNILVDAENSTADRLQSARQGINNIYLVKEPMHVVYGCGEKHMEADVDVDNIIIAFYESTFDNPIVIVKNDKWADNIKAYEKSEEENEIDLGERTYEQRESGQKHNGSIERGPVRITGHSDEHDEDPEKESQHHHELVGGAVLVLAV